MTQFYLNNAVGIPSSVEVGGLALKNATLAFDNLANKAELNISPRVVLEKDPEIMKFGEVFLGELIHAIPDEKERQRAYLLIRGAYPMEDYFEVDDDADLPVLAGEYKLDGRDAFKLALVHKHHGLLLTFAFDESLCKNALEIVASAPEETDYPERLSIDSLYNEGENANYIEHVILEHNGAEMDLFDEISNYGHFHNAVARVFNKLSHDSQVSIVEGFKTAIEQGLLVPNAGEGNNAINPNDELVRYEQHTKHEMLFEIAIYHPLALRIFIAQHKGELYILDIKSKKELGDGGATQNAALRAAERRFTAMKKGS